MLGILRSNAGRLLGQLSSGYGVTIEPQPSSFCCLICHDMDDINDEDSFDRVIEFDRNLGIKATLFVMRNQLKFKGAIHKAQRLGFEVGLHNTHRPYIHFAIPYTFEIGVSKFTEMFYGCLLRGEIEAFNKAGVKVNGFAPHGVSCHLFYDDNMNWDVIENASLSCGVLWVRGYRGIIKTDNGGEFGRPIPLYWRAKGDSRKLVIPVSWDDKFLFPSWEEKTFYGGELATDNSRALESIRGKLAFCEEQSIPFVINLHPTHWLKGVLKTDRLLADVVSYCRDRRCPVYTFSELYRRVAR